MLKLILKNLWSRRRNNGWLMAELILVVHLVMMQIGYAWCL